jgi:transketolase
MAMAGRINQSSNHIYCLIGDGEANEGSIWESVMLAAHHKLSSLCCIVDYNHSTDRALNLGDIGAKFTAFGWKVYQIDGHNHYEIKNSLQNLSTQMPTCIIARTIKGKGCRSMEGNPAWHHRTPTKEEYKVLLKEIELK